MNEAELFKEGILLKSPRGRSTFGFLTAPVSAQQVRIVKVYSNNILQYFEGPILKGEYNLTGSSVSIDSNDEKSFEITSSSGGSLYLTASSAEEAREWVGPLRSIINNTYRSYLVLEKLRKFLVLDSSITLEIERDAAMQALLCSGFQESEFNEVFTVIYINKLLEKLKEFNDHYTEEFIPAFISKFHARKIIIRPRTFDIGEGHQCCFSESGALIIEFGKNSVGEEFGNDIPRILSAYGLPFDVFIEKRKCHNRYVDLMTQINCAIGVLQSQSGCKTVIDFDEFIPELKSHDAQLAFYSTINEVYLRVLVNVIKTFCDVDKTYFASCLRKAIFSMKIIFKLLSPSDQMMGSLWKEKRHCCNFVDGSLVIYIAPGEFGHPIDNVGADLPLRLRIEGVRYDMFMTIQQHRHLGVQSMSTVASLLKMDAIIEFIVDMADLKVELAIVGDDALNKPLGEVLYVDYAECIANRIKEFCDASQGELFCSATRAALASNKIVLRSAKDNGRLLDNSHMCYFEGGSLFLVYKSGHFGRNISEILVVHPCRRFNIPVDKNFLREALASEVRSGTTDPAILMAIEEPSAVVGSLHVEYCYGGAQNGVILTNLGLCYHDLPSYLQGLTSTMSVNDGNITFSLSAPCTAYLVRNEAWWVVDLALWTHKEELSILTGSDAVYTAELPAGDHNFSNSSAMYLFDIDGPAAICQRGCSADLNMRERHSASAASGKGVVSFEVPLTPDLVILKATLSLALPIPGAPASCYDLLSLVRKIVGNN